MPKARHRRLHNIKLDGLGASGFGGKNRTIQALLTCEAPFEIRSTLRLATPVLDEFFGTRSYSNDSTAFAVPGLLEGQAAGGHA